MSDERIWYAANRILGWDLFVAGIVIFVVSHTMGGLNSIFLIVAVGIAIAHSFFALRKL